MASTVKAELDKANPSNVPDLQRLALMGRGLAECVARTERLTVTANVATPDVPARQILRCRAVTGGTTGNCTVVAPETTPIATQCAVDPLGRIEFAAADGVTACEVTYIPQEGDLVTGEVIPVTAGGVGTFLNGKACGQIVSAVLNAPAATPGAKTVVARGTAVPGAGNVAVTDAGTTIQFQAAEAAAVCTATVSYYAFPHVGTAREAFGERLDGVFTP